MGWAKDAVWEGEFAERDRETLRFLVPRLGLAEVRAFGSTWEEGKELLSGLGYRSNLTAHRMGTASHGS